MKKFLFSHGHFSEDYRAKIVELVPSGWHAIHTNSLVDARETAPDILFILSGSKAQQKRQAVSIRFGCGSSKNTFEIFLGELSGFFKQFETTQETEEKHSL